MNNTHGLRQLLRAPWQRESLRCTVYLCLGAPLGALSALTVLVLAMVTAGLAVTVVFGVRVAVPMVRAVQSIGTLQRSRYEAFFGVTINAPAAPEPVPGGRVRRRLAPLATDALWRAIGYHLLSAVFGAAGLVVAACWTTGALLATVWLYVWVLPAGGPFGADFHQAPTLTGVTLAGVLLVLAAPWLARSIASLDAAAARSLLGPNRNRELARRVVSLAESRTAAVHAADTERRRIERDLHDGAQQRLVALAMNLGIARATLPDLPDSARAAIVHAHDEAKQALVELRDFVRGLYPAVLDDLGLDAALSGIAARAPLPVRLTVDLPSRPPVPVEAVAYFVVAEALTNATRHAGATRVDITVRRVDDRLMVTVRDDGHGGARTDTGSGLRGLADRLATVDGTLLIDSPVGGPTLIIAELPCASS